MKTDFRHVPVLERARTKKINSNNKSDLKKIKQFVWKDIAAHESVICTLINKFHSAEVIYIYNKLHYLERQSFKEH